MRHRRSVRAAVSAPLAGLLLAAGACAPSAPSALRVSAPGPGAALLRIAAARGTFRSEGAAVEIVPPATTPDVRRAFETRALDAFVTTASGLLQAREHSARRAQAVLVLGGADEPELLAADSLDVLRRPVAYGRLARAWERARAWAIAHPAEAARLAGGGADSLARPATAGAPPLAEQWSWLGRAGRLLAALRRDRALLAARGLVRRAEPVEDLLTTRALPPDNTP